MKTLGSSAWSCIRTRSPRIAPPLNGDVGSTHSTPTSRIAADAPAGTNRSSDVAIIRSVSVDLPAPGAPVMPMENAR